MDLGGKKKLKPNKHSTTYNTNTNTNTHTHTLIIYNVDHHSVVNYKPLKDQVKDHSFSRSRGL